MRSDSWFFDLFRQWPDLILRLVENLPAEQRQIRGYTFMAPVLKAREHRLDGVLLPPQAHPELPVVILEVQMFPDPRFLHRLYAETARYLLQHPNVMRWQVVVIVPEARINLGPTEPFSGFLNERVSMVSLEDLSQRPGLEPLEELLTLVIRAEADLGPTSRRLMALQPELGALIASILWRRLPHLLLEEIMTIAGIQLADISETRAFKDIKAMGREEGRAEGRQEGRKEGREEGEQREAAKLVLRLLRHRFGTVSADLDAAIRGLPTSQLESLGESLLDFTSPADLEAWLASRNLG